MLLTLLITLMLSTPGFGMPTPGGSIASIATLRYAPEQLAMMPGLSLFADTIPLTTRQVIQPPREPFVPIFSVTAGAGLLTTPEVAELLGSLFAGVLLSPFAGDADVTVSATGPYVVGLAWHRNPRRRLGLRYSYQNIITTYRYQDGRVRNDVDYHTIMFHSWRRYAQRGIFTAYGTADVGLAVRSVNASAFGNTGTPVDDARDRIPLIAGQFNLLGIAIGSPRVQVYTELGWGYLGLVQFGARVGL